MLQRIVIGVCIVGGRLAAAQQPAPPGATPTAEKPDLKQCYQVIRNDSVRMFYDAGYTLTPPDCASIRRLTRLAADGNFTGEVRDYWMDENTLALRLRYANGKAEGSVEQYHRNGKPAVRGQVVQGVPTGEWQYWYASGRPQQVLRFPADGGFRIVAYWDSTGQQRVTGGNGHWEGFSLPNYYTLSSNAWVAQPPTFRFRGPVADGQPHGRWESLETRNGKVFTTENFVHGRFRSGQLATKPLYGSTLMQSPKVVLEVEMPGVAAERFRLGPTCAQRTREQQRREALAQMALPRHALEYQDYGGRLMKKIRSFSSQAWYEQLPERTPVVCVIDSLGAVAEVLSVSAPLQAVVKEAVRGLPAWQSATFQQHYALGGFILWIDRRRDRAELSVMTTSAPYRGEPLPLYARAVLDYHVKKGF